MKNPLRLLSLLLAGLLALPVVGGEGGESAGGTGVWILPRCTYLASGSISGPVRESRSISSTPASMAMTVSNEIGSFTATLVDSLGGSPIALPTNGNTIVLSEELLRALREAGASAQIVVSDSQLQGYVIQLTFDSSSGPGRLDVY